MKNIPYFSNLRQSSFTYRVRYYIPSFKIGTLETSNLPYVILWLSHIQDASRCFSASLLYTELLTGDFMPYHFNNYVEIPTLNFRNYQPIYQKFKKLLETRLLLLVLSAKRHRTSQILNFINQYQLFLVESISLQLFTLFTLTVFP